MFYSLERRNRLRPALGCGRDMPDLTPEPRRPELRASDADREHTADLLRRAAGEGRLTVEELDERLDIAYETRTRRELEQLVADVVVDPRLDSTPGTRRFTVRPSVSDPGSSWIVAVMSGADRKGRWRLGRLCTAVNVMGGSDIDLNEVELADEVVELRVIAIMGGSDIRVPEGLNVEKTTDFALMGANGVDIGDMRPNPDGPVLRLRLFSIMGGIDVKRGPKLSRRERREQRPLHRH